MVNIIHKGEKPGIRDAKYRAEDGNISYDEMIKLYPMVHPRKQKCILFLFWDDVISYTSIGLMDFLNMHHYKKSHFEYYLDAFLERKDKYLDGLEYAKVVMEENLKIEIPYTGLEKALKENYNFVIQHSPLSGILNTLSTGYKHMEKIFLCFKHKFPEGELITSEIKREYFDNLVEIQDTYLDEVPLDLQIKGLQPDIIFGGNIGKCMQICKENNLFNREFVGNIYHNGLEHEFLMKWSNQIVNCTEEGYKMYFYKDTILNNIDPEYLNQLTI